MSKKKEGTALKRRYPRGLHSQSSRGRLLPAVDDLYQQTLLQYERFKSIRLRAGIVMFTCVAWPFAYHLSGGEPGPVTSVLGLLSIPVFLLGLLFRITCKFLMEGMIPSLHDLDQGRYAKERPSKESEGCAADEASADSDE